MVDMKMAATVCTVAAFLIGGTVTVETRYAKSAKVELLAYRLEQKIEQDRYWWLKERLDRLQKEYQGKVMPVNVQMECNDLAREIEDIELKRKKGQ